MKKSAFKIGAFLIWPLWGFIDAAFNFFGSKWDKLLLVMFSGFIGLNIAITSEGPDINRYKNDFIQYQYYDFEHLYNFISNFIYLKDGYFDIGIQIINYIISRFTDNYHVFFLILGIIYGLFYANILYYLSRYFKYIRPTVGILLFICSVFFFFPTQVINQFRFWTGSAIFLTGSLLFLHGHRMGLLLILVGPLMHIGISLLILGIIIFLVFKRVNLSLLIFALPLAIVLNIGFSEILEPIISTIGGSAESKFNSYTGQFASERLEAHKDRIWYAAHWRSIALFGFSIISISFYRKIQYCSQSTINLFRLNLIFLFFGLLMQGFYMHFRYYEIFIFLHIIFFVKFLSEDIRHFLKLGFLRKTGLIIIILIILMIKIPATLQFLMPTVIISNFITAWFFFELESSSIWHLLGF